MSLKLDCGIWTWRKQKKICFGTCCDSQNVRTMILICSGHRRRCQTTCWVLADPDEHWNTVAAFLHSRSGFEKSCKHQLDVLLETSLVLFRVVALLLQTGHSMPIDTMFPRFLVCFWHHDVMPTSTGGDKVMVRRTSQYSLHFPMVCFTFYMLNSTFSLCSTRLFYMVN